MMQFALKLGGPIASGAELQREGDHAAATRPYFDQFPHVKHFMHRMAARPAFQRAMKTTMPKGPPRRERDRIPRARLCAALHASLVTPLILQVEHVPTPLGEMLVLGDGDGFLRAVDWKDCEPRMRELLRRQYGAGAVTLVDAHAASPARQALERYLAGELRALDAAARADRGHGLPARGLGGAPRDPGRPDHELRRARPQARPATGRARCRRRERRQPVGIVIPCHRVVGSDGALTGYGGGLQRKRWLLDHERTHRLESR